MEEINLHDLVPKNYQSAKDILNAKVKKSELVISDEDIQRIHKKAYLESLQCFFKTAYLREHVRQFAEDGTLPYTPEDPKLVQMLHNQANSLITKPPYILLTVNPKEEDLPSLMKAVEKFVRKKSIKHYVYCYEVRNPEGGLHCHILLEYDDKPYNFKRGAKNTFKNVCNVNNPHILNFKFIEEEHILSKINYLKGEKKDSKKAGVDATIIYRKEHNLSALYESTPSFPCRGAENEVLEIQSLPAAISNID